LGPVPKLPRPVEGGQYPYASVSVFLKLREERKENYQNSIQPALEAMDRE
jgi:hypothetical protein